MPTLAEILADAQSNDLEVVVNGNTFKVSDLRALADDDKAAAKKMQKQAEDAAKEAATILTALQAASKEMNANSKKPGEATPTGNDWKKEAMYAPLVPAFEAMEQQAKDSLALAKQLKDSLDKTTAIYGAERLRHQWESAKVRPEKVTFEDAVKEVLAAQEVDHTGLPTMEKFLYRKTESARIKAAVDEALAKNNKEWEDKNRIASVQKPGSQTKFAVRDAGKSPIKKIEDLTSEMVANDPEIQKIANGEAFVQ